MTVFMTNRQIPARSRQIIPTLLLGGLLSAISASFWSVSVYAATEEDSWARTVSQAADSVISLQLSRCATLTTRSREAAARPGS